MKKIFIIWGLAFGFGITLGLSACRAFPKSDPDPTPTPVIPLQPESSLPESESLIPTPTQLPPLRFVIPTPGAEPISDWRPPLYPIPWAISPYDHFYFARPIAANEISWPLASYLLDSCVFSLKQPLYRLV